MAYVIVILLGLCFGSFINALIWRIHEQEKQPTVKKSKDLKSTHPSLSIVHGRSMCPRCGHILSVLDLLPVVSWLGLRGKCRYCHEPISIQYPAVELLTTVLFVVSYLEWPYNFNASGWGWILFGSWLALLVGLIALAVYDIKWMLLPNRIIYPLMAFWGVIVLLLSVMDQSPAKLVTALWGVIFCGGVFWVLYQVSKGNWIGGGDVKLGFLLGLVVGGPVNALLVIFVASSMGTILMLPLLATKKIQKNDHIPFGPFLIVATILVFLFGGDLLRILNLNFVVL